MTNTAPRVKALGPVPTHECEFRIGQSVHLAKPYAEDDPNLVYFVTGIRWEHRYVSHRGWDITIATAEELARGYGQTDGFKPSDLLAALEPQEAEPKPELFILGNTYRTVGGDYVKLVTVANAGSSYETMADEEGVHRYTRRDFGRVTGTDFKNPDPRNILPVYTARVHASEKAAQAWPEPKVLNPDIANPTGVPYIDCLLHRLLNAQQDINLAANEGMDQSLCDASALVDEVEKCIRLSAAATAAHPVQGWQTIDTAPSPVDHARTTGICKDDDKLTWWQDGNPTHWMPLPAGPSSKETAA